MTKQELKAYLMRVRYAVRAEERIIEQILRLRERVTSLTKQLSDMPRGGSPYTLEDYVCDLDRLERQLGAELEKEREAFRDVLILLSKLEPVPQDIMIDYYLNDKTWEEIAIAYGKSYRWVQGVHKKSLEEILKLHIFSH